MAVPWARHPAGDRPRQLPGHRRGAGRGPGGRARPAADAAPSRTGGGLVLGRARHQRAVRQGRRRRRDGGRQRWPAWPATATRAAGPGEDGAGRRRHGRLTHRRRQVLELGHVQEHTAPLQLRAAGHLR